MKNLNKVLAMLVVFVMMLSTVAFASSFTDVADTSSYSTAIEVGVDLGLIKGYADGTFAPEGEITRAEFAAIVVRLLGQEAQAEGAKVSTQFIDVPADHWAAGYVNIAVQAKVINGYGNGNFGPDDLVEYQDAITMMVRALGYEPAIGTAGYPTGYLTKAGELGLTSNVNGTNGVAINRGAVAQIAFNALDVPLMTQSGYGTFTQYVINDGYSATTGQSNVKKTLLSENHDTVKVMGTITSSTDATSSSTTGKDGVTVLVQNYLYNKFGVGYYEYYDPEAKEWVVDGTEDMLAGDSEALAYVGKKCVIFVEVDEFRNELTIKSLYEVESDDNLVINLADIDEIAYGSNKIIYAVSDSKTAQATFTSTASVFYNGVKDDEATNFDWATEKNRLALLEKSGSIELANLTNTAKADYDTIYITSYDAVVVDEVKVNNERVEAKAQSDNALRVFYYGEDDGDVKASLFDAEGNEMDWADLEENTVLGVKYVATKAKSIIEAQVIENVVTGSVTSTYTAGGKKYAEIDGVEYKVITAMAELDRKAIQAGDEGTYYLSESGIVWYDTSISKSSDYAVVLAVKEYSSSFDGAEITLLTKENEIVTYDVTDEVKIRMVRSVKEGEKTVYPYEYEKADLATEKLGAKYGIAEDSLITFKANSSDRITAIDLPIVMDSSKKVKDAWYTTYEDEIEDYFTQANDSAINLTKYDPDDQSFGEYILTDSTVVYDVTKKSIYDREVVNIANLAKDDKLGDVKLYDVDEDGNIGALVIADKDMSDTVISGDTSNATFVVSTGKGINDEGDDIKIVKGILNGEEVVYECDTTVEVSVATLVLPKYKSNGDVEKFITITKSEALADVTDGVAYVGTFDDQNTNRNRITVGGAEIKVENDANVYVYDKTSNKKVNYVTDAYVGYFYRNDDDTAWATDKLHADYKNIKVYAYEYDKDVVDVLFVIDKNPEA